MLELQKQIQVLKQNLAEINKEKQELANKYMACQIQRRSLQNTLDSHAHQDKQTRQLKSALADCKFELRKMGEDIATERSMGELEKIKFLKKYDQKIMDLKAKMQNDNKDWIRRFDLHDQQHQQQLKQIKQRHQKQSQQQLHQYHHKIETRISQIQKQCQQKVQRLKIQKSNIENKYITQKQVRQKQAQKKFNQEIKRIQQKAVMQINKKQKEFIIKMSIMQNQKTQEVHQHENTKKQFGSIKETLYEQLGKLSSCKDQLQGQIKYLKVQTEEKQKRIAILNSQIKELEMKHQNQIKNLVDTSKKNLQSIQNKSSGDIQQILKSQLIYVETMQHKIQTLQNKHLQQIRQYNNQIDRIKECFDQRPTKTQDLHTIRGLKEELFKKQKECQLLQNQLRWFKMQLDNKQDMYTKFFAAGYSMNELKAASTDRPMTRSPAIKGQYKPRRIGRSLLLKRKLDDSKTDYGSFFQSKNWQ